MNIFYVTKISVVLLSIAVIVGACSRENSAESAGKSIDTAIEDTNNEVKKDSQKMQAYADDAAVTAKVKAAILAEAGMKVFEIDVETNSGVTTLKGEVDSSENKEKVEVLVASVDGVKRVDNKLKIELEE